MGRFDDKGAPPDRTAQPGSERAELAAAVIEGRTFREVTIHGTREVGRMRVLSRAETRQVRVAARKHYVIYE